MGDKVDTDCSTKRGEDRRGWRLYTGLYYYVGKGEYRVGFKLLPDYSMRIRPVGMTLILNPFKRWNT